MAWPNRKRNDIIRIDEISLFVQETFWEKFFWIFPKFWIVVNCPDIAEYLDVKKIGNWKKKHFAKFRVIFLFEQS